MLFNSGEFNCVKEMAVIVAMLQVENIFLNPPGQSAKAKMAKRQFEVSEGDLLTLLNVFNAFQQIDPNVIKHWCSSKFLRSVLLKSFLKKTIFKSAFCTSSRNLRFFLSTLRLHSFLGPNF